MSRPDPADIHAQTRRLWAECFGDTEEFLDIYFSLKYTDEANIVRLEGSEVAAAAQLLPYRMRLFGQEARAGYVSGLCTRPGARGKGHAAHILREVHRRLHDEGAALCFLIPGHEELRTFYEQPRHGNYRTATYRKERRVRAEGGTGAGLVVTDEPGAPQDLHALHLRASGRFRTTLLHSERDFRAALAVCRSEGGRVLAVRRGGRAEGFCLAVPEADGRCFLRELEAVSPAARAALLAAVARTCGPAGIRERVPATGREQDARPYAMARVVNAPAFLEAAARGFPGLDTRIGVRDDLDIPRNNGCYLLARGRCVPTEEAPDTVVTPGELASLFLDGEETRVRLMLDE